MEKFLYKNKKAWFNYQVPNQSKFIFDCGLSLTGLQVKQIRDGRFNWDACWVRYLKDQNRMVLQKFELTMSKALEWSNGNRKSIPKFEDGLITLLLKKSEMKKINEFLKTHQGYSLIPLFIYENEFGLLKMQIALCDGKNSVDKKNTIKERDLKRELQS